MNYLLDHHASRLNGRKRKEREGDQDDENQQWNKKDRKALPSERNSFERPFAGSLFNRCSGREREEQRHSNGGEHSAAGSLRPCEAGQSCTNNSSNRDSQNWQYNQEEQPQHQELNILPPQETRDCSTNGPESVCFRKETIKPQTKSVPITKCESTDAIDSSSTSRSSPLECYYGDGLSFLTMLVVLPDMGSRLYNVLQVEGHPKKNSALLVYGLWISTAFLAILVLFRVHHFITRGIASVVLAKVLLVAVYIHHTVNVLSAIDPEKGATARENLEAMIKAAVIAGTGLVATGTFHDEIWHKKQLEVLVGERTDELLIQHEKLEMVNMALQATDTAITITDESGRITWVNASFEQMGKDKNRSKGSKGEELIGRALKNVIYDIDPSLKTNKYVLLAALDDIYCECHNNDCDDFKSKKRKEFEIQIGSTIYQLEATPFLYKSNIGRRTKRNINGTIERSNDRRILVAFKDITETRAREKAEKNAKEEAMMSKAMADSMVTLTHELRTPLQGIMGVTSLLLQAHELTFDAMESLKLIMASSSLLLNLINNLLDVKKASSKMLEEFPLSSIAASGPIEDSISFCKPMASISDVELVTDTSLAPKALVRANALRLQQVLINLVSNAIKYSDRGSKVTINIRQSNMADVRSRMKKSLASSKGSAYDDGPVLIFTVSDSGPGIKPEEAHRLFHRFAKLDSRPRKVLGNSKIGQPSGTGLGLHLCDLFIDRMHGHIWANSNTGKKGSSFSFSLPLLSNGKSQSICGSRHQHIVPDSVQAVSRGPRSSDESLERQILLVDDTLINRKVISRILKRIGFANVTSVDSGEAALIELAKARKNPYDLVITDLQMPPGMSGTDLTKAIFKSDAFPRPIVIGITADTGFDAAGKCRASGMSDLLYKPITVEETRVYMTTKVPLFQPMVWNDESKT